MALFTISRNYTHRNMNLILKCTQIYKLKLKIMILVILQ